MSLRTCLRGLPIPAAIVVFTGAALAAPQNQAVISTSSLVPVEVLQPLLPAPPGWTRAAESARQISLSSTCDYTFATVAYENDKMRIKVTLADSGRAAESLMALAPMLVLLPDDYSEKIPPATIIRRLRIADVPAAERWDGAKSEGELTLVVNGRFVVSLEGTQLDSVDTLRAVLQQIDLKKVAELK